MRIVYNTFGGRYSDSPRAIYEALAARADHAVQHTWTCAPDQLGNFPADVELVPFGSAACVKALEAADVVVSNDHLALDWNKSPDALYLQTWHGTPLKRIHRDVRWAPDGRLDYLDHDVARWDHLLSPNPVSTERLRRAFGFTGPIHETGYPRNDVLSSRARDALGRSVRERLGIPDGKTVVLYAPTWRDDLVFGDGPGVQLALDLEAFTRSLGRDHVLLLRLHNLVADRIELPPDVPVLDVSTYRDVSELYLAADVLVTDYSSVMFDFAVTGRPILLFTYDLEDYRDRLRGFYFDLEQIAPGPLLRTSDEVIAALGELPSITAGHAAAYRRFQDTFCRLEDGRATARVLELFFRGATP